MPHEGALQPQTISTFWGQMGRMGKLFQKTLFFDVSKNEGEKKKRQKSFNFNLILHSFALFSSVPWESLLTSTTAREYLPMATREIYLFTFIIYNRELQKEKGVSEGN